MVQDSFASAGSHKNLDAFCTHFSIIPAEFLQKQLDALLAQGVSMDGLRRDHAHVKDALFNARGYDHQTPTLILTVAPVGAGKTTLMKEYLKDFCPSTGEPVTLDFDDTVLANMPSYQARVSEIAADPEIRRKAEDTNIEFLLKFPDKVLKRLSPNGTAHLCAYNELRARSAFIHSCLYNEAIANRYNVALPVTSAGAAALIGPEKAAQLGYRVVGLGIVAPLDVCKNSIENRLTADYFNPANALGTPLDWPDVEGKYAPALKNILPMMTKTHTFELHTRHHPEAGARRVATFTSQHGKLLVSKQEQPLRDAIGIVSAAGGTTYAELMQTAARHFGSDAAQVVCRP